MERGGRHGEAEVGTSSQRPPTRWFPMAAQPEIMRAAEKDEQYASFLHDACRDAFRQLFGAALLNLLSRFFLFLWCFDFI